MHGALSQDKRIAAFQTPLGRDALVLTRFEGSEGVSELFELRIDALSERPNLDFDGALGQNCGLRFNTYDGRQRAFSGVLVEAQWLGARNPYFAYRLVLRPWLWLLGRTADCKIFHKMTAPEVIQKTFNDANFNDFRLALTEGYPKMEYCVQYRETDLAFVSRLMEQHGIYYFFEHQADRHVLVLADAKSSHQPIPGCEVLPFLPVSDRDRRDREHVHELFSGRRLRTGRVALNDYDYKQPNASLLSNAKAEARFSRSDLEVYDYPGKYDNLGDGERFAKVRLDAEQALDHRRHAVGDAISLFPGGLTMLKNHPRPAENVPYLVMRATHAFTTEQYRSGEGGSDVLYVGSYEFHPADRVFRAPLTTPKPLVNGPQTAKVVGAEGEEIDVDELGRILVRFHWDRDEDQSRRVRVAQVWSGRTWGGQIIPRIGQEAVVEFLEGDPDRPLVVGTVYNQEYQYPYSLPANKTQSGLKSDTSKGGRGFNEFRFEDKEDAEQVYLRAEKDHDLLIRHAETREIGEDFPTPKGSPSRTATLKNGDDHLTLDTGNWKVQLKQGDWKVNVDLGKIEIEAMQSIKLKVGASTLEMTPASIELKSVKITVDGVTTDVKGAGILTLQGGLVKIN